MRFALVLGATASALALWARPAASPPLADPICVQYGPYDVLGQPVVPYIYRCIPGP